jgi:hypothetical protein
MTEQTDAAEVEALGHSVDEDELIAAVTVTIARVRCEALHGQTNGGRCTACIAWAKRNASRYLPRFRPLPPAEKEADQ